jgi:hypothetical protein
MAQYCPDCIVKLRLSISPFHGMSLRRLCDNDWEEEQGYCSFCKTYGDIIPPQRSLDEQRWLEIEIKIIRLFYEEYVGGDKHSMGRFYYTDDYADFSGGLPKSLDKEKSIEMARKRRSFV